MSREAPAWQPYDPLSSPLPPIRGSLDSGDEGAVVVLLSSPGLREGAWSARAAASLASGLARSGRRVFLADLDLTHPALHGVLGVTNENGVSDAFVFGASIQHVARAVDDGRYFFAPAGTVLGDPSAVAASLRWEPILEGFRTARADVVLLVPADQEGSERLLEYATDVVLLAPADESEVGSVDGAAGRVRAVLGPGGSGPGGVLAGATSRAALSPPEGALARPGPDPVLAPSRAAGARPTPAAGRLVILLLLLLAAVLAAWWFGVLDLPGLPSGPEASAPSPDVAAGPLPSALA